MAWDELAFGKILYSDYSIYSYSRIPHLLQGPRYFITTKGLVIRGGHKGIGDLLLWDRMIEPGVIDGNRFAGIDITGTVNFSTPITLMGRDGNKQEFPKMPTSFYRKLMQAWNIAKMFSDGNREIALLIWKDNIDNPNLQTKQDYINKIYEYKIKKIFRGDFYYQNKAMQMFKEKELKLDDIDKNGKEKIKQIIDKYNNRDDETKDEREDSSSNNKNNTTNRVSPIKKYQQHRNYGENR